MLGASPAASCSDGAGRKCLLIASGQRPKDVVRMSQKLVDASFDDFDGQDVSLARAYGQCLDTVAFVAECKSFAASLRCSFAALPDLEHLSPPYNIIVLDHTELALNRDVGSTAGWHSSDGAPFAGNASSHVLLAVGEARRVRVSTEPN
jgi:hypothetical protein